jgi:hypothetical protein
METVIGECNAGSMKLTNALNLSASMEFNAVRRGRDGSASEADHDVVSDARPGKMKTEQTV